MEKQFSTCEYILSLSDSVEVNAETLFGNTPLHYLVRIPHPTPGQVADISRIMKLLVKKGVDVNKQNTTGETPLFLACYHGSESIISLLIHHGSNKDIVNM